MAWTNTGKQRMFEEFFEASSVSTDFRLLLASSLTATGGPVPWNSNLSSTSQVGLVSSLLVGSSGLVIPRSTVTTSGFDVSSGLQLGGLNASAARAVLQTAGDAYQYSGALAGAEYVLLVDGKTPPAAFVPANAEVYAWWSIGSTVSLDPGNTLTITGLSLQGN